MKEYAGGKKCLSPSIFRKSKGPIVLVASSQTLTSTGVLEAPVKSLQSAAVLKKNDTAAIAKELSLQDYDLNQCMDLKDVHCK